MVECLAKRAEPKPPGRKKQWLWDSVKASLIGEIVRKPELLDRGPAAIVEEMKNLFNIFQPQGGHPDNSDLFEYAQKVIAQNQMHEPAP